MLHISSFSSSNFEFLNMHISLDNFSCHMCDVIGVNRSMKREYVKALDQLSSPITNRWMIIIGLLTVQWWIMRQSGIPTCIGKDVGRVFLHSPRIRCGGKHRQYFANAGPLYLRRIIVYVLITLQGGRLYETLPNWCSMDTIGLELIWNRYCSGRHQQRKQRCGFATQTPRSLRLSAEKPNGSNLFVF